MNTLQIPDPSLRRAVEKELNKATGDPIGADEMRNLKTLDVRESGVCDLTGLEHAKNLSRVSAGGNSVSDLSPLKGLVNLRSLDFWG